MPAPAITALTEADHADVVALNVERFPDTPESEAAYALGETFAAGRVLLGAHDADGRLAGYGIIWHPSFLPDTEWITRVVVRAGRDGDGVGRLLWQAVRDHVPPGTTAIRVAIRDDEQRSVEVARHWGFEVGVHSMESRLPLVPAPPAPSPPVDVTFEQSDDLHFEDQPAVEHMFEVCQTDPEARLGSPMTLEQLRTVPEGSAPLNLLMRVDGRPAAISCTVVTGETLFIYYTGVDPAFRGRGLAKLLKQQVHALGAAAGATECRTSNVEDNVGIRRINADLGYVVGRGMYRMVQHLG